MRTISVFTMHREDEINLLDVFRKLMRRKKFIAIFVFVCTVAATIYSLLATKIYKSEATLFPIGQDPSAGLAALIGSNAATSILGSIMMRNSLATPLIAILESRSLAERLIERHNLKKVFYDNKWDEDKNQWKVSSDDIPNIEDALIKFEKIFKVTEESDTTLIRIEAFMEDPKLSAGLVSSAIEELDKFLLKNELTVSKRNRIFIEGQLENYKAEFLETGKKLSQFYSDNQISNRDPRLDVDVTIMTKIQKMGLSDISQEIARLKEKKEQLAGKLREARIVKNVPQQVYLEYLTGYYNLLGEANRILTQQYELAKIEEAKEDISFQVIDPPRVPIYRYSPKRKLIVIVAFAASLFLAVIIVFFLEYMKNMIEIEKRVKTR